MPLSAKTHPTLQLSPFMTSHLKSDAGDKTKTHRCHCNQRICLQRCARVQSRCCEETRCSALADVTPASASIDASARVQWQRLIHCAQHWARLSTISGYTRETAADHGMWLGNIPLYLRLVVSAALTGCSTLRPPFPLLPSDHCPPVIRESHWEL